MTCGNDWSRSERDGTSGLGQELSALNVILANLKVGGRLATANGSATEAGSDGTYGSNDTEIMGPFGDSNGTTTDSASSAGQVAVSSMVLAVAVGSMMAFL